METDARSYGPTEYATESGITECLTNNADNEHRSMSAINPVEQIALNLQSDGTQLLEPRYMV